MDTFQHQNLTKNEYGLTIASLTDFERAKILYNHIWFSGLPDEYVEEIYKAKRYRAIISHRNFNPRLIRFITDRDRLTDCKPEHYWQRIERSLANPSDVWEHPFVAQQDDYGRILVLLVTVNARAIHEEAIAIAFARYVEASPRLSGNYDFVGSMKQLTGSFLSRTLQPGEPTVVNLFNPSIGDYVLRRYSSDIAALTLAISSLRSPQAFQTLKAMTKEKHVSSQTAKDILEGLLFAAKSADYQDFEEDYLSRVFWSFICAYGEDEEPLAIMKDTWSFLLEGEVPTDCTSLASVCRWAVQHNLMEDGLALAFLDEAIRPTRIDTELQSLSDLLKEIRTESPDRRSISKRLKDAVIYAISDDLERSVAATDIFADTPYGDYEAASEKIADHISELFAEFNGVKFTQSDIDEVLGNYDVDGELNSFYHQSGAGERSTHGSPHVTYRAPLDDIDDLFEK